MTPPGTTPTNRWHNRDPGEPDIPDFETHTHKEKQRLVSGIIKEFIAECCLIKALDRGESFCLPSQDALRRGTIIMLHTRPIPIWLVFAFAKYGLS